tara:strand:- start:580 stop:1008 length:429 start_codon:yes stop_codon:yes gene_type:complete
MHPEFWGPSGWKFLHSVTFQYPIKPTVNDKAHYKEFFNSLKHTLPCEKCAYHYTAHLRKFPIDSALETREKLVRWLINVHNEVNKSLGKREYFYEEVIDIYKDEMDGVLGRVSFTNTLLLIIILVFLYLLITGRIRITQNIY